MDFDFGELQGIATGMMGSLDEKTGKPKPIERRFLGYMRQKRKVQFAPQSSMQQPSMQQPGMEMSFGAETLESEDMF